LVGHSERYALPPQCSTTPAQRIRQTASIIDPPRLARDPGRSGLLNPMHLLRESALLSVDAPQPTHGALRSESVWASMSVHAHFLVTGSAMATGSLARNRSQELDLCSCRLVVVTMVTVLGRELAAIGMEIVHVAHFDSLDALNLPPVSEDRRIDALTFLVVTLCRLLGCAWNGAGLWKRRDSLRKLGPRLHTRRFNRGE
jgi:hypothetical protein